MTRTRRAIAALCLAGMGAVTLVAVARRARAHEARAEAARLAAADRQMRRLDIDFYRQRVERDPRGAADRAMLGSLYLQAARESGDAADWRQAEAWARASLSVRAGRNARALLVLSSSLLGQHRFTEARTWAESLVAGFPDPPGHRALLGEIQLELGDYAAAERTMRSLAAARANLAVAPRLARWHEVHGRPEQAHAILVAARDSARKRLDLPLEQVLWFQLRLVDLALRYDRLDEAARELAVAEAMDAGDRRMLAARVRLAAATGRWREAVRWGARAESAGADIATLALIGDAHAALGDSAAAGAAWQRAELAYRGNPEPYARQWTLFRLEHGRELDSTRALLEREIVDRRDVLGWDLLALARHLTGDRDGALAAVDQALRTGTLEPATLRRAAVIRRSPGGDY